MPNSRPIQRCQSCGHPTLEPVLFLGYLPPVNQLHPIGSPPAEQPAYPAELLHCPQCRLVQLGLSVAPHIIFPESYPYTSSTTRILRENFAELAREVDQLLDLAPDDLVLDIGSNDGNLLSNFHNRHRILGITPEAIGQLAIDRGIPTHQAYFDTATTDHVLRHHGPARLITATNVFAHIDHPNETLTNILRLLPPDGVFLTESHHLLPLIQQLQYDTIYHEHLRYYSLHSLQHLLRRHGLHIFHARPIPPPGGSIRVYAARHETHPIQPSVAELLQTEATALHHPDTFPTFRRNVSAARSQLHTLLHQIHQTQPRPAIFGIGAPSRAATLANYCALDDTHLACIVEIAGSHKIGHYLPGTRIPILDEAQLFQQQPPYALLLSWHIANELAPKLWQLGYRGNFIVPLPQPRILHRPT